MVSLLNIQKISDSNSWKPLLHDVQVSNWTHDGLRVQTESLRKDLQIVSDRVNVPLTLDMLFESSKLSYEILDDSDPTLDLVEALTIGRHILFSSSDIKALDQPGCSLYNRARFTVVHEIDHALQGHSIYTTGLPPRFPYESAESEANAFAAHFLMPMSAVKRVQYDVQNLAELCHVSLEAAHNRINLVKSKNW